MQEQITSNILMIRPVDFTYNSETAGSNKFQQYSDTSDANKKAQQAFDHLVDQLKLRGINVRVFQDTPHPFTPDSIFPNNWISMHHSGKVVLYPMEAENRRLERRSDIVESLRSDFHIEKIFDISHFENQGKYLEGTGSLVLDRIKRIAYACISSRTHTDVLKEWQKIMNYELVTFSASDTSGAPIYHTNVVMAMGDIFCIICLEAIKNLDERLMVKNKIEASGKEIIEITMEQMYAFAGNMLLLKNTSDKKYIVMSQKAFNSLHDQQIRNIEENAEIITADLGVIEDLGGGSARCMIAEIHLPEK